MRVVLLGDIHLYRLWLAPWHLLSKRLLGQGNLVLNRRRKFNHALLPAMIEEAVSLKPDMVLLSGDVTTTSLRQEFEDVEQTLRPLTERFETVLVPGNHDRYTFTSARVRRIDSMLPSIVPDVFPHIGQLDDRWSLLAFDSAVPRFYNARGRLGDAQFKVASQYLDGLQSDQGVVVMCHYPCALPRHIHEHQSHSLEERDQLRGVLERCKARVVYLHGHIHRPWHHEPGDGSGVPFTCINAGSPCMVSPEYPRGQGFYEIELPGDPLGAIAVHQHTV